MTTITLFGTSFDPDESAETRMRLIAAARVEILAAGVDSEWIISTDDPDIIVIAGEGGGAPVFQFGADGRLLPIVRRVAQRLDARSDPLGVAA